MRGKQVKSQPGLHGERCGLFNIKGGEEKQRKRRKKRVRVRGLDEGRKERKRLRKVKGIVYNNLRTRRYVLFMLGHNCSCAYNKTVWSPD